MSLGLATARAPLEIPCLCGFDCVLTALPPVCACSQLAAENAALKAQLQRLREAVAQHLAAQAHSAQVRARWCGVKVRGSRVPECGE